MAERGIESVISTSRRVFADNQQDSQQPGSVATLLQATNALFRRPEGHQVTQPRQRKRGRRFRVKASFQFVLMNHGNYTRVPSSNHMKVLERSGLGERKAVFSRSMTKMELEDKLVLEIFPSLSHGFKMMKAMQSKRLQGPITFDTVATLKTIVRKGKVYILPPRSISLDNETNSGDDVEIVQTESCDSRATVTNSVSAESDTVAHSVSAESDTVAHSVSAESDTVTHSVSAESVTVTHSVNLSDVAENASRSTTGNNWPSESADSSEEFEERPSCPWGTNSSRQQPQTASVSRLPATNPTETQQQLAEGTSNLPTGITGAAVDNSGLNVSEIRAIQDAEYMKSLALDLEKDKVRRDKELEIEQLEIQKELLLQLKATRKSKLQDEPSHGTSIKFRTSNGTTHIRRFSPICDTDTLYNFVGSMDEASEFFEILPTSGPSLNLSITRSLSDLGVSNRTLFHVKWLTEVTERHQRPQRGAAALGRVRVQEWVNTIAGSRPRAATSTLATTSVTSEFILPTLSNDDFEVELDAIHDHEELVFEQKSASTILSSALTSLAQIVVGDVTDGNFKIIVRRSSALKDALMNVSRAQQRLVHPLSVRFIGEPAVDDGGPTRELASEIVAQFASSQFVEGPDNNRMFRHDFKMFSDKKYLHLGQLVAILLLQGGQGLPVFSCSVTEYILSENIVDTIDDLPETLRKAFKQLQDVPESEIRNKVDELFPKRFNEGYPLPSILFKKEHLPELAQAMVAHHVILKQKMVLDQFIQGLQIGGVLEVLRNHHGDSWKLFKGTESCLTMDMLENMLVFNYGNLMPGSNRIHIAQGIEQGWILLLQAAESNEAKFTCKDTVTSISLSDILKWLTGASRIPAIGLRKVDIYFDKDSSLPRVNTCSLEVYMPLLQQLQDADQVSNQLIEWIVDSQGFGLI